MEKVKSVDEFFENLKLWNAELTILRSALLVTELIEEVKWGVPTYTLNGKNIVSFSGFKNYFAIWFFQGSLLADKSNILINAQEGKTKALRQWRFKSVEDINIKLMHSYLQEAIVNQKEGREIAILRSVEFSIPLLFQKELDVDNDLLNKFKLLSKGKQKEYCNYISEAKRETTKNARVLKIIPMIRKSTGLHDKYKN